jgi:hypothetical protein
MAEEPRAPKPQCDTPLVEPIAAESNEEAEPPAEAPPPEGEAIGNRTSRDALLEEIGVTLLNAGVVAPAPAFVADVRRAAGFRASPREVAAAVEQLAQAQAPITPQRVATTIAASRGGRSQRQQRHASEWRALGAALSVRGLDGSPAAQRDLIGVARAIAGPRASDVLLLGVALGVAEHGGALDAKTIGAIGRRLARSAADLDPEDISRLVREELRALARERAASDRPRRRSSSAARRASTAPVQTRRWKPGGRRARPIRVPRRDDQ